MITAVLRLLCFLAAAVVTTDSCYSAPIDTTRPINDQIVQAKTSEFDSASVFSGPTVEPTSREHLVDGDSAKTSVRVLRDKKSLQTTWYVVSDIAYFDNSWRRYSSVNFPGGRQVQTFKINSTVLQCRRGCNYLESVAVELTAADVKAAKTDGLRMRWNPTLVGQFETSIPAAYFEAMEQIAAAR